MEYQKVNKQFMAEAIKSYRLSQGLTQEKFGKKFNPPATKGIISRWEKGTSIPNPERLKEISEMTGKSTYYLITGIKGYEDLSKKEQTEIDKKNQNAILESKKIESKKMESINDEFPELLSKDSLSKLSLNERALLINTIEIISTTRKKNNTAIIKLLNNTIINAILSELTSVDKTIESFNTNKQTANAGIFAIFTQLGWFQKKKDEAIKDIDTTNKHPED